MRHLAPVVVFGLVAGLVVASPLTSPPSVVAASADHRVYMMTDSVGLGAKTAVPAALSEYQVTVDGTPALFVEQLESKYLRKRMSTSPSVLGDIAVVAAGYNYSYWDPARFERSVDSMIATLERAGVKRIIWVTLREVKPQYITAGAWRQVQPYYWYFPQVNEHLRRAVERHPDLSLADWAAIADQEGLTYDAIHLNSRGASLYSSLVATEVRSAASQLEAGSVTKVTVAGVNGVPAGAKAVAVNLTVTTPQSPGFITAFPCGIQQPATSNLNYGADQTVAVSAIVNVGVDGQICVYNSRRAHVLVDVQGYFAATSSYRTIPPTRLVDTRDQGSVRSASSSLAVAITGVGGVPPDATAVAINVTIADTTVSGFALAYPCDAPPVVPTALVNYIPNTATPNFTIAKPGADGTICISTSSPASVIVDAFGYFPAGSPVEMTTPTRLVDTRGGPLVSDVRLTALGGLGQPTTAAAVMLSVTAASPRGVGFVVVYPCGGPTAASTLNVVPDRATTNAALVAPATDGTVCVHASVPTHLLVDVWGWVLDGFVGLTPWRAFDSRG